MSSVRSMNGSAPSASRLAHGQTMYLMPLSDTDDVPNGLLQHHHNNNNNGSCSATGVEASNNGCTSHQRLVYPYWAWKPCVICQCQRPPRAHHCPLCNTCVLKRDHHCFFTGSCVGLRNQRHFVVFSFWAASATCYCMLHSLIYLVVEFLPEHMFWDLFLPVTVVRCALGYVAGLSVAMIFLLYSLFFFCLTSVGFFVEQMKCIVRGVTSFEVDNNIKVTNCNSRADNIRGVFGDRWLWNFLCPMHHVCPTQDDGVAWKYIKA